MVQIEIVMVIAGVLLLISVFANRLSGFLGIPGLLIFIGIGMLAGSDGIGRIQFYDARVTNHIGTVALIFILFAGGLDIRWRDVRPVLKSGALLATVGVVLTGLFLFLSARFILGMELPVALLLGAIVSSTDAPAVFMIMRTQKGRLRDGLRPLLEFESGSNDPMAVLLSLGALTFLQNSSVEAGYLLKMFAAELVGGFACGYVFGRLAAAVLKKVCICYFGLYTVFGVGLVFLLFGLTQLIGGNGFLAVYVCGIVLGNRPFMYRRNLIRFHDSLSWIAQVGMFLLLGLLVNPRELPSVMPAGLLAAFFLIFVSRPAAVFICLWRSRFNFREKLFISWAGLKGAVPIILATYPLMIGFPDSQYLFNLIFFLVISSVLLQGKTLPYLATGFDLYYLSGKEERSAVKRSAEPSAGS